MTKAAFEKIMQGLVEAQEYVNSMFPPIEKECQDAVEGRARFARPNIQRPSKAIGE